MKQHKPNFIVITISILIGMALLAAYTPAVFSAPPQPPAPMTMVHARGMRQADPKINPLVFRQAVRKQWEDHVTWTRVYIIAAVAGLPEAESAAQRLLQNQVDIGNAIKPFYGDAVGDKLTALLKDHILIAIELLDAAKSGDAARFEAANKNWYDNADQIAAFVNSANPDHWPLDEMQSMMRTHLNLTLEEATARLSQDWAGDVAAYDKIHDEILEMADMLVAGIIGQFPKQFDPRHTTQEKIDLTLAMDKLWEDHVTWTRMYIISATSGLPDAEFAAQRLLQNQADIGDAIKPLYGEQAGEQLTSLLTDHILTAVDLLAAARSGDQAGFEAAKSLWYENADQIATFLNSANPKHWPLEDMRFMMRSHLDLTLEEAVARLNQDWAGDVAAYDQVHDEILEMSGMLTEGIVAQFPAVFH